MRLAPGVVELIKIMIYYRYMVRLELELAMYKKDHSRYYSKEMMDLVLSTEARYMATLVW